MKVSPSPTSCRNPHVDRSLAVTIRSHLMKTLFGSVIKTSKRGRCIKLIVPCEDSHELLSFANAVVEKRRTMQALRVIRETDQRIMREVTEIENPLETEDEDELLPSDKPPSSTGSMPIIFLAADRLAEGVQKDFIAGQDHARNPWPLVIACFPTPQSAERASKNWPVQMLSLFTETLAWPALKERQHDLEGIATEICTQLNQDGKSLRIKPDALNHIRRMKASNVSVLYREIRKARDFAIITGCEAISADDFDQARRASEHPRSASHPPASTTTTHGA